MSPPLHEARAAQNEGEGASSTAAAWATQMVSGDAHGFELPDAILAALNDRSFEEAFLKLDRMVGLSGALGAVSSQATQEKRDKFQQDVKALRINMSKATKGFINPRSPYIQWWDLGAVLAP